MPWLHLNARRLGLCRFLTNEEFPFKRHSENFSALLALHHLEPTRPYEKLFPSPFREAWLSLSGETPQKQQSPQQQGTGGAKRQSAKSKASRGAANAAVAAVGARATEEAPPGGAPAPAEAAAEPAAPVAAAQSTPPTAESARASSSGRPQRPSNGARRAPVAPTSPTEASEASPERSRGAAGSSSPPASFAVQISSAHKFASEFERQQAAETCRLEEVRKEKQRELQRLEEEAQMPTVFMAEAVRKKVALVLKDILPHAASASAMAAAAAAARAAQGASANPLLLPLHWSDSKWLANTSLILRKHISSPRSVGALKMKILKELTGPLGFEKSIASLAVESCLAVLQTKHHHQHMQQRQEQQHEHSEAAALEQLLESCQDFIAVNTADEASLPAHFSPAGKQIEIRCPSGPSQQENPHQHKQDEGCEAVLKAAKGRLRKALMKLTEESSAGSSVGDTLQHLTEALWSLCCSTGLHVVAAAALEQQQQAGAAAGTEVISRAFTAVAAAAAAVVGVFEEKESSEILRRLETSRLLVDPAVLQKTEAVSLLS